MDFPQPLQQGHLVKRYKRFLADISLDDGTIITAHCPNTGPMTGLVAPGSKVLVSPQSGKNRKLAYTWEMVWVDSTWVGTNTQWPNQLVQEAFDRGLIDELSPYKTLTREVAVADSRLDFYATNPMDHGNAMGMYVEVKNVHSKKGSMALFPDAVTTRGAKHLRTLRHLAGLGYGATMIYVIQRNDCTSFSIDAEIDPDYALAFKEGIGINFFAYTCDVSPQGISLMKSIPVQVPI